MKLQIIKAFLFLCIFPLGSFVAYSQTADHLIFDDAAIELSRIGSNTIHSDFGPSVVQNTLYFTSFNDSLFDKTEKKLRKRNYYDLYKVAIDRQGKTIGKRVAIEEFKTRYNDGPVSWCQRTGELFVTQNYEDQTKKLRPFQKEINRLKIVIAKQNNGEWSSIVEFPFNSNEYSVGHPAINEMGDTLIFSSDQPGGFGQTDLYYSVRKEGEWSVPVNLGATVNTTGKEEFPFLTDHGLNGHFLIFSSNGRSDTGGLDLYYTKFPSDAATVHRFSSPINSIYDDFGMTIPVNEGYGYLTSNRPGTGSDDIYCFNFNRPELPPRYRELFVYDRFTKRPIVDATVNGCDGEIYHTDRMGCIASLLCIDDDCEIMARAIGYLDAKSVLKGCVPDQLNRDTIWIDLLANKKVILHNIYYDFDRWNILPQAARELDQLVILMIENPAMIVELSAHTDARGSDAYNLSLSKRRAQSAVDYIVSKGISKERVIGKGYGESQLINDCGTHCTGEQHRENRRTELLIPGFLRGEAVKQVIGDYSDGQHQ